MFKKKSPVLWLFSDLLGERLAVVSASHWQLVWWIQMKKLVSNASIYQEKKHLEALRPGAGTMDMKRWFLRQFIKIWENPGLKVINLTFPWLGWKVKGLIGYEEPLELGTRTTTGLNLSSDCDKNKWADIGNAENRQACSKPCISKPLFLTAYVNLIFWWECFLFFFPYMTGNIGTH